MGQIMVWMWANKLSLNPDQTDTHLVRRDIDLTEIQLVLDEGALLLKISLGVLLNRALPLDVQRVAVAKGVYAA